MVMTSTLGRTAGRRLHHTDAATAAATAHAAAPITAAPRLLTIATWTAGAARGRAGRESAVDWYRSPAIARAWPPPHRAAPPRAARDPARSTTRRLVHQAPPRADRNPPHRASSAAVNTRRHAASRRR